MPDDPFADLTDTFQERQQRETRAHKHARKQQSKAFVTSLGAILAVATAAGIGGAGCGWVSERNADLALDRFLGGVVCGLAGGVLFCLCMFWIVMRRLLINEALEEETKFDVGAILFGATLVGAVLFGGVGTALGLMGKGVWRWDVFGYAVGAGGLALIVAVMLKVAASRTNRTRFDPEVSQDHD